MQRLELKESFGTECIETACSFANSGESAETSAESKEKTGVSREKIVVAIRGYPNITMAELAEVTGLSAKGVEKNIRILREENVIRRVGPDKGGYWEVIEP